MVFFSLVGVACSSVLINPSCGSVLLSLVCTRIHWLAFKAFVPLPPAPPPDPIKHVHVSITMKIVPDSLVCLPSLTCSRASLSGPRLPSHRQPQGKEKHPHAFQTKLHNQRGGRFLPPYPPPFTPWRKRTRRKRLRRTQRRRTRTRMTTRSWGRHRPRRRRPHGSRRRTRRSNRRRRRSRRPPTGRTWRARP